jgi:hypothetical protein
MAIVAAAGGRSGNAVRGHGKLADAPRQTAGGGPPAVSLDEYDRQSVVGGLGAFVIVADTFEDLGLALRRKLTCEIADLPSPGRIGMGVNAREMDPDIEAAVGLH